MKPSLGIDDDVCWFLDQFWDGFMPCFWHVWCRVCGMFCGLNWENIVADGQGLFLICHAPNPAPDGVSSEGVTLLDWDSLTFAFSELTPVPVFSFIYTIFVIKKFILHIHYKYHRSGIHVLYTESHYFSIYKTYTYSKNTEIAEAVR